MIITLRQTRFITTNKYVRIREEGSWEKYEGFLIQHPPLNNEDTSLRRGHTCSRSGVVQSRKENNIPLSANFVPTPL